MSLNLLFSPQLISEEVQKSLPGGYKIRPLDENDYDRGFLDVLTVLTTVGNISKEQFQNHFKHLQSRNDLYYTLVIIDPNDRVVAVGTVIIERKFIHELGSVGHIEDIAVDKNQQGKKFGLRIIQALTYLAGEVGAYKTILDCSKDNIPFYERCGFKHKEYEMVYYYEKHKL